MAMLLGHWELLRLNLKGAIADTDSFVQFNPMTVFFDQ